MDLNKIILVFTTLASVIAAGETLWRWWKDDTPKGHALTKRIAIIALCLLGAIAVWPASSGGTASAGVHYERALQFFNENNRPKAAEEAKAAILLEPTHLEAHKILAACYLKDRNYSAAATEYKEASNLSPDDLVAQFGLASSLRELGKYTEAKDIYRSLLKSPQSSTQQRQDARAGLRTLGK